MPTRIWHCDSDKHTEFREVTERTHFARGEGLSGRIWVSGEPAWIVDVQEESNFPRAKLCDEIGVRGAFGFPIKIGNEMVAILEFFAEEKMSPDDDLLRTVETVGDQVGRVLERRRAEEALRESKNFILNVIDNSTAGIYAKDLDGRYLLVNKTLADMLGKRPADIVGKTPHDFFPPDIADQYLQNDQKVIAAGEPIVEEEQATVDGVERTYMSVRFPIHGAGEIDVQLRMVPPDFLCHRPGMQDDGRNGLRQFRGGALHRLGDQIGHHQIIFVGARVLEVGYRVNADGVGDLPRVGGQFLDQRHRAVREHLALLGREDEQNIVVLGVDVLQLLERGELRVVLAEEGAVIGVDPQVLTSVAQGHSEDHAQKENGLTPANDPFGVVDYGCIDGGILFFHVCSISVGLMKKVR